MANKKWYKDPKYLPWIAVALIVVFLLTLINGMMHDKPSSDASGGGDLQKNKHIETDSVAGDNNRVKKKDERNKYGFTAGAGANIDIHEDNDDTTNNEGNASPPH